MHTDDAVERRQGTIIERKTAQRHIQVHRIQNVSERRHQPGDGTKRETAQVESSLQELQILQRHRTQAAEHRQAQVGKWRKTQRQRAGCQRDVWYIDMEGIANGQIKVL